jgi:hypothetical protein
MGMSGWLDLFNIVVTTMSPTPLNVGEDLALKGSQTGFNMGQVSTLADIAGISVSDLLGLSAEAQANTDGGVPGLY